MCVCVCLRVGGGDMKITTFLGSSRLHRGRLKHLHAYYFSRRINLFIISARKDADKLAHAVYEEPGSKVSKEIASEFGVDVVERISDDNVQIDRKKLGAIVFSDPASMLVRTTP